MSSTYKGKNTPEETTTIRVKKSTKKALEKQGIYGETHDAIIRRIIKIDIQNIKQAKSTKQDKEMADKL